MKYNFLKGLKKAVVAVVLFGVPLFITQFPEWANLTIGGVLVLAANWIKVKFL
jgi:hypothetical protein